MKINIRLEEEKDYRRVEEITRDAFDYPDRIKRGQIGCPYEHWMVHELRQRDGIMALSFVAELENGTIIGHIICSNAVVKKETPNSSLSIYMPYIIAPIYEFFNHNVILYKTVKSATFVNSQDERALPANRK